MLCPPAIVPVAADRRCSHKDNLSPFSTPSCFVSICILTGQYSPTLPWAGTDTVREARARGGRTRRRGERTHRPGGGSRGGERRRMETERRDMYDRIDKHVLSTSVPHVIYFY